MAISYREALRIAKQVKMQLASGADGSFVKITPEDRKRMYKDAARKAGRTVHEKHEETTLIENLFKHQGNNLI